MPQHPLKTWFEFLQEIHDHLLTLNHLTEDDLKDFSRQSPSALLPTDLLKGNLSQFCFTRFEQHVPEKAYSLPEFRQFVDVLAPKVQDFVRALLYSVAAQGKPEFLKMTQLKFLQVNTTDAFPTPQSRDLLFDKLSDNMPTSFFPNDSVARSTFDTMITTANRKVAQAVSLILT